MSIMAKLWIPKILALVCLVDSISLKCNLRYTESRCGTTFAKPTMVRWTTCEVPALSDTCRVDMSCSPGCAPSEDGGVLGNRGMWGRAVGTSQCDWLPCWWLKLQNFHCRRQMLTLVSTIWRPTCSETTLHPTSIFEGQDGLVDL